MRPQRPVTASDWGKAMNIYRVLSIIILLIALIVPVAYGAGEDRAEVSSALAMYYKVTPEEVAEVRDAGVSSDDLAVVLCVSQLSKTSSVNIAKLRARGDSWLDIMKIRSVGPESFYVMIAAKVESRIYAPILDKYASVRQSEWKSIELTSEEIINLVNLKFVSSQYDYSIFKIMEMRDAGGTFLEIAAQSKAAKDAMAAEEKKQRKQKAEKGSG